MSWSLYVVPVDGVSGDGMAEWLASAGVLREPPGPHAGTRPRPSIAEVLDAFRAAGCHGTNWFEITGERPGSRLPECPGIDACTAAGAPDLGEVSVHTVGRDGSAPVAADAAVETVAFRKPNPAAVLRAVCALAALAGPQVVFDDSGATAFPVHPGAHAYDLAHEWPW